LALDDATGLVVEVSDLVTIGYNQAPDRPIRIRLSKTENHPTEGIVHISQPLAAAVLGVSVDDEIEVVIGGAKRTAVVEHIERAVVVASP
jgi:transcription elongation GreA/GreB family factor